MKQEKRKERALEEEGRVSQLTTPSVAKFVGLHKYHINLEVPIEWYYKEKT